MPLKPKHLWPFVVLIAIVGIYLTYQTFTTFRDSEILIDWETASEVDTVGFNILRGKSPEGELTQINPQLIPASADPLSDNAYTYTDTDVEAGVIYYYYLEDVEANGETNRHGPLEIQAAGPKWLEASLAGVILLAALVGGVQLLAWDGKANGG